MKIILDTKWDDYKNLAAIDAEVRYIAENVLRDEVNVKPHLADDGTITLEILDVESKAPEVPDPTYVVEIADKYTYLVEPHVVGRQVTVGMTLDLPGQHEGAHWAGRVTRVMSAEDFEDTEGELPAKFVLGIL